MVRTCRVSEDVGEGYGYDRSSSFSQATDEWLDSVEEVRYKLQRPGGVSGKATLDELNAERKPKQSKKKAKIVQQPPKPKKIAVGISLL